MDASEKAGADLARRFPFFEVGRFMRDFQQACWGVKLIPARFWLEMRRFRKRLAGGFPVAGWGGGGLAQKGPSGQGREVPDGDGSKGRKDNRFDSLETLQRRAVACKAEGCPLAAEVERRAREVDGQEAALWADAAEVRRGRKENAERERAVTAREVAAGLREREMDARERAVEARERAVEAHGERGEVGT